MTTADTDSTTLEAFVTTAAQGDSDTIKSLLEKSDDPSTSFACTLCAAAYNGHLEIIELLIARGADVNANDDGETALLAAVRGAQSNIIQSLIEAGADVRVRLPGGASALHQAVTTDQSFLIPMSGVQITVKMKVQRSTMVLDVKVKRRMMATFLGGSG